MKVKQMKLSARSPKDFKTQEPAEHSSPNKNIMKLKLF